MTGILFFQLLGSVVIIALTIFAFDQPCPTYTHLLVNVNVFASTMIMCYVYCYFSERFTERAFDIGDMSYNSLWYKMSMKEQKLVGLVIRQAQKEFRMSGYGIIKCSLGAFQSVIDGNIFF